MSGKAVSISNSQGEEPSNNQARFWLCVVPLAKCPPPRAPIGCLLARQIVGGRLPANRPHPDW